MEMDNKQLEFVRKYILLEKTWLLFWKELQNWKVQGSIDVMHFKLRSSLDISVYGMRFARTNSWFRLLCGYKPGRDCEDFWRWRRQVCRYVCRTPTIITAVFQWALFLYLGLDLKLLCHSFPNVKYFVWCIENPQCIFVSCDLCTEFSSWFLN